MVNSPNSIKGFFINSSAISINLKQGFSKNYSDFSYMFYNCIKLISVDLSIISLEKAYYMKYLFSNCYNLESIIFPKNEIYSSIHSVSHMFYNCQKLSSIDISNFCFNKTSQMQYFFSNCRNLETIIFPKQLNYNSEYMNGEYMFSGCSSLSSIDLSFLNLKGIINIDYMFLNCSKLETIKLNANLIIYKDENGPIRVKIHDDDAPWEFIYKIGHCCIFKNCNSLKNIDLFYSNTDYIYKFLKDLSDLEGCLFNIFDNKIKKCSKYMGFYYCGECKNINTDEYCIKEIEGNNYTFYYLYEQFNLLYNERNCFWSDNYDNFGNYYFVKNSGIGISYYIKNTFKNCDISCMECENKNNQCKKCNINYYEIFGHKNGTCFKNPLETYGLIQIGGEILFKSCYYLCKNCFKVTDSLFYQQCKECNEIDYTLDLYSYQKSYCIPKDKSDSTHIKYQTKWYIEDFEGIERLTMINRNMDIDYESLLNDMKYRKINYKIVDNCPFDKPFIIYSIRQCVSSCNSNNLVEYGLFMTKKLYLFNNICYDECPYGSIKDENEFTCKEIINQYIVVDNNISIYKYLENNQKNIIDYLSKYDNNSIGITRLNNFSNFFYSQTLNESIKIELGMAIFDFDECIKKLITNYQLDEETNIFLGIMEYDSQKDKNGNYNLKTNSVNLTNYQFFTDNGTILNYSVCLNLQIKVQKKVETKKLDINLLEELEKKFEIKLYDNDDELKDYCTPLFINNKDLTLYDKQLLAKENIKPCDDNCIYQSFNFSNNYSTCICFIIQKNYEEMTNEIILEKIRDNIEEINSLYKLLDKGNYKYFKCLIKSFKYIKYKNIIF